MTFVVFHYHFRPGGVRRVIELAMPHLLAHGPGRTAHVLLAGGEAPDDAWLESFRRRLAGAPTEVFVNAAFGYVSELRRPAMDALADVRSGLNQLLQRCDSEVVIWAHNLGLGRNARLARELARVCDSRGVPLIAHHHDWWFDGRWSHYAAMREGGLRTLTDTANALLGSSRWIAHAAINETDALALKGHFAGHAGWLPNPVEPMPPVSARRVGSARAWLKRVCGEPAPVWLLPCRLLRRKNIAEALLLTRWLRPGAWLVTTAGVSSPAEAAFAARLGSAARRHGWRLRLAVLEGSERAKPSVPELMAASEAILLTSVQEGFGLPYLEAAAARRPLLARRLPNTAPDLARFGFAFPQYYEDILIAPELFDWTQERDRQRRLFADWRRQMPRAFQQLTPPPPLLAANQATQPVPFSRLTLTAQLEVLSHSADASWAACAPVNPLLESWRERAATGTLQVSAWPRSAERWLGGRAYARRFFELLPRPDSSPPPPRASVAAQADLVATKLTPDNFYPLLWHPQT